MMSSKDTSTPGSQLSHRGDLLSVSRRQCSARSTQNKQPHAQQPTHTQTGGLKSQMRIVMLKNKSVQTRVHTRKHSKQDAFSHPVTLVGDYLAQVQRRERTRDRRNVAHFPNNLLGPDCAALHFHTERESTAYQFTHSSRKYQKWCHFPDLSDFNREKELYGWFTTIKKT